MIPAHLLIDPNVPLRAPTLYITLTNPQSLYKPGNQVQGNIHINASNDTPYQKLLLRLNGTEQVDFFAGYIHVSAKAGSTKVQRRKQKQKCKCYCDQIVVCEFMGGLKAGQYTFGFQFLLPQHISGSFRYNQSNCISYCVIAQLQTTKIDRSITYQKAINIIQSPRIHQHPLRYSQCLFEDTDGCCCCWRTRTLIILQSDKTIVSTNEQLEITLTVDNNHSSIDVTYHTLQLVNVVQTLFTNHEVQTYIYDQNQDENSIDYKVPHGEIRQFKFVVKLPHKVNYPTVLGSYIGNYYYIRATFYDPFSHCWTVDTDPKPIDLPIYLVGQAQKIVKKPSLPPPSPWNPKIMPKTQWKGLKPYKYVKKGLKYNNNSWGGIQITQQTHKSTQIFDKMGVSVNSNVNVNGNFNPYFVNNNSQIQPYYFNQPSATNLINKQNL